MRSVTRRSIGILVVSLSARFATAATAEIPDDSPAPIVVRLVHPERLASSILKLFEGERAPHPAAALAAWKRASREPDRLGKALEAVMALFNPEMAPEWRVLDGAELWLSLDGPTGAGRWLAIIPHDDGTAAAALTAMRLTDGADLEPISSGATKLPVERLGRPGAALAVRTPSGLLVATNREELSLGLTALDGVTKKGVVRPRVAEESTVIFDFDPGRFDPRPSGSLNMRRAVALVNGFGIGRIDGRFALVDDKAITELTTTLNGGIPNTARIDRHWLERIPSADAVALVSLAIAPTPDFWSRAFAAADRVELADPAQAGVVPLRTRLNLLALPTGASPEAHLWPHLRGATACLYAESGRPGQFSGGLLILHVDNEAKALELATQFFPRIGSLLPAAAKQAPVGAGDPRSIGRLAGRDLTVWSSGRDVLVGWGDRTLIETLVAGVKLERSVAAAFGPLEVEGRGIPQRLALFWPARGLPAGWRIAANTPAFDALAANPPMIWRGWNDGARAIDSFEYADLKQRVHRFLERIPLSPPPIP